MPGAADSSLPIALLRLALALAAFVLPGALWANFLTRNSLPRPARITLGFALSFAVFGLLGWPYLWHRRGFDEFLQLLYPAWAVFAITALVAQKLPTLPRASDEGPPPANLPRASDGGPNPANLPRASGGGRVGAELADHARSFSVPIAAYFVAVLAVLNVYAYASSLRSILLRLLPLLLIPAFIVARRIRHLLGKRLEPTPLDEQPPPRLWILTAAIAIGLQLLSVFFFNRPDWDDCYYLAAVLDYEQAPVLNAEEPSHREGLPVPTQHRTLCWELWGAVLARVSGLSPLSLFHSYLPLPLLLLAYAAYAALLRELLPRRYVPLGILALSALHLWGISSHSAAANFLLPRLGQAKSVLLHLAAPLATTLLLRQAVRPGARLVVALTGVVLFALAISLSAIFVMLGLLGCLALALAFSAATTRRRIAILVAAALSTAPLLLAGLLMRAAMKHEVGLSARPTGSSQWLETLQSFLDRGSTELLWFLTLPLLAVLIRPRRDRAYLFIFPIVVAATLLNPVLFHLVAGSLTSYHTYARLYWLLPIAPALAVGLALLCRIASGRAPHQPLWLALGLLVLSLGLPGMFVFGYTNSYIGPLGTPRLLDNLDKIPGGLLPIAKNLAATPDVSEARILCNEQIASFLTPYSRAFRFVQTRALYTPVLFSGAGRTDEGIERALLGGVLRRGKLSKKPEADELLELHLLFGRAGVDQSFGAAIARASRDLSTLLTRYRVHYVLTGPGDHADVPPLLLRQGYTRMQTQGEITLWQRQP